MKLNKFQLLTILLSLMITSASLARAASSNGSSTKKIISGKTPEGIDIRYVAGEIVVKLKPQIPVALDVAVKQGRSLKTFTTSSFTSSAAESLDLLIKKYNITQGTPLFPELIVPQESLNPTARALLPVDFDPPPP